MWSRWKLRRKLLKEMVDNAEKEQKQAALAKLWALVRKFKYVGQAQEDGKIRVYGPLGFGQTLTKQEYILAHAEEAIDEYQAELDLERKRLSVALSLLSRKAREQWVTKLRTTEQTR